MSDTDWGASPVPPTTRRVGRRRPRPRETPHELLTRLRQEAAAEASSVGSGVPLVQSRVGSALARMREAPSQAPPEVNMPEERVVGRQMTQPRSPSPIPEAPTKHDLELGHSQSTLHRRSPDDPNQPIPTHRDDWHASQRALVERDRPTPGTEQHRRARGATLGGGRESRASREDWHARQRKLANPPADMEFTAEEARSPRDEEALREALRRMALE
jgi:hypothetical protein